MRPLTHNMHLQQSYSRTRGDGTIGTRPDLLTGEPWLYLFAEDGAAHACTFSTVGAFRKCADFLDGYA